MTTAKERQRESPLLTTSTKVTKQQPSTSVSPLLWVRRGPQEAGGSVLLPSRPSTPRSLSPSPWRHPTAVSGGAGGTALVRPALRRSSSQALTGSSSMLPLHSALHTLPLRPCHWLVPIRQRHGQRHHHSEEEAVVVAGGGRFSFASVAMPGFLGPPGFAVQYGAVGVVAYYLGVAGLAYGAHAGIRWLVKEYDEERRLAALIGEAEGRVRERLERMRARVLEWVVKALPPVGEEGAGPLDAGDVAAAAWAAALAKAAAATAALTTVVSGGVKNAAVEMLLFFHPSSPLLAFFLPSLRNDGASTQQQQQVMVVSSRDDAEIFPFPANLSQPREKEGKGECGLSQDSAVCDDDDWTSPFITATEEEEEECGAEDGRDDGDSTSDTNSSTSTSAFPPLNEVRLPYGRGFQSLWWSGSVNLLLLVLVVMIMMGASMSNREVAAVVVDSWKAVAQEEEEAAPSAEQAEGEEEERMELPLLEEEEEEREQERREMRRRRSSLLQELQQDVRKRLHDLWAGTVDARKVGFREAQSSITAGIARKAEAEAAIAKLRARLEGKKGVIVQQMGFVRECANRVIQQGEGGMVAFEEGELSMQAIDYVNMKLERLSRDWDEILAMGEDMKRRRIRGNVIYKDWITYPYDAELQLARIEFIRADLDRLDRLKKACAGAGRGRVQEKKHQGLEARKAMLRAEATGRTMAHELAQRGLLPGVSTSAQ